MSDQNINKVEPKLRERIKAMELALGEAAVAGAEESLRRIETQASLNQAKRLLREAVAHLDYLYPTIENHETKLEVFELIQKVDGYYPEFTQ